MAKVVNLYKNKYDVYIGRAGKGKDGYFGNPVAIDKQCPVCRNYHRDGASTLPCYETYLYKKINDDLQFRTNVKLLKDKTLGCFCKPKPCHGDILVEVCNELNRENISICEFCNVLHTEGEYRFGKHICNKCINEES